MTCLALAVADDRETARQAAELRSAMGASAVTALHLRARSYDGPPTDDAAREVALVGNTPDALLAAAVSATGPVLEELRPSVLVSLGDSPASLGAALCAVAHRVPVVRVGAGRRSYDRNGLSRETSRVLQDHLATVCVAEDERTRRLLLREGMSPGRARTPDGSVPAEMLARLASAMPASEWHPLGENPPASEPNDLTPDAYRHLIGAFREAGYTPSFFPEAMQGDGPEPLLLLRHDIDMSLEDAARMAELEVELDVRATYFFLLRTDFYNILSASGTEQVAGILGRGHRLGLHLDLRAYGDTEDADRIRAACRREVKLLSDWLGYPVDAVSFHRPPTGLLKADGSLTAPLPHTALPRFTREMKYLSESRGCWREGSPLRHEAFRAGRSIQLLTHPLWWDDQAAAPLDRLMELADRMRESLELSMARNNQVYRVGWLAARIGDCR